MNYIIGLVGLSLIILDVFGISISIGSYTVYVFASLVVSVKDFSKLKKAKLFGLEMEFDHETQKVLDKALDIKKEVKKSTRESKRGLSGIESEKRPPSEIRFFKSPNHTAFNDSEHLLKLLVKLLSIYSIEYQDLSTRSNILESLTEIEHLDQNFIELLNDSFRLLDKVGANELKYLETYLKRLDFIFQELIKTTEYLIENPPGLKPIVVLN